MEKEYKFRALTSNKDVEIKPITLAALKFAIDNNSEVTNVAITGNYGAGKSSVVESFEEKRKKTKFIHISLGQYDEIKSSEKNGLDKREINTIEGKIINQLLHQIDPNKIRKSIFKTLDAESQINPLNITLYLSLTILLSLYLFNISSWSELVHNFCWLSWTTKPIISLLVLITLFILIVYGIYFLLKLQKDFGFIKKLSLKAEKVETDIEIFSNESSRVSYFDRYLDDVLYLFKQSEADVIVFEDIERFNDSRIFEKLKELNIVINRKRKICGESKLVFFYLVKDDLFESQERTKFFDFIIPVVPVVTASNSHDILKKLLTEMREYTRLDKTFLFNISLYLDDMRLINNICNEYLTYKETLSKLPLEREKIFSMVVYKNIFPKDFSLLQRNQGYLYELLNSKEIALKNLREELNNKKNALERKIENAEEEHLNDEVELYGTILKIPSGRKIIKVNGKFEKDFSTRYDYIKELIAGDSEIYSFDSYHDAEYNQYKRNEDIDSLFPSRNTPEFQERLKNTKNKKIIEKLREEIKKINDELGELDSYRLSDVYQYAKDIDDFKSDFTEEIRKNPQFSIISFLIRNTYIDESYQDYLNYFYENTITVEEKEYLRNVISGRQNKYNISLKNFDEIFNYLELKNYKSSNVLNYDLFRFLLYANEHNEKLKLIFHQDNILEFLLDFYNELFRLDVENKSFFSERDIRVFLIKWLHHNSELFNEYIRQKHSNLVDKRLILSLMNLVDLYDCTKETKEQISKYLEMTQEVFLNIFQNYYCDFEKFKYNLSAIDFKIKEFDFESSGYEENVLNYIYKNRLYDICKYNVLFFMERYSDMGTELSDVKHKNYEIMTGQNGLKPLLDYCQSSDEEFLKYILMYITLSEGEMRDKPEYIEQLLNNNVVFNYQLPQETLERDESDDSDNDEKIKNVTLEEKIISSIPEFYITYTQDKFNDLSSENRELLVKNLVQTKKAEVNTEIVLEYFSQNNEGDTNLVDFINQSTNFRLDNNIYQNLEEEIGKKFQKFIIKSLGLKKTIRIQLLRDIGIPYYEIFDDKSIDNDQLQDLMSQHLIDFNKINIDFIKEEYSELIGFFILYNINDYLNFNKEQIDIEQLEILYEQNEFEEKIDLKILALLLDNHYNEDYFIYLIDNYTFDEGDKQLQENIQKIVKKYIKQFIELDEEGISYSLYESILNSNDVSADHKKKLLEKLISVSENRIKIDKLDLLGEYLDLLELPDIMQILKEQINDNNYTKWEAAFEKLNQNESNGGKGNQDAKVPNSKFNKKLLDYLKKRELISNKSGGEGTVLKLYGFRTKQIEFKDSLGENHE
ncbi:hypothetical protein GMD4S_01247 [Streptococcus sp. GMD4S]|nr:MULTISPECIES: hypothetical protein [unclassified Streptococcus]EKA11947.1 hypothetical protein GMD4S_01247 [Streptococcus sp. GMD4S]EKA13070.1 hypothetical protein GMD1S_09804 [Streptococcus sp. GMD1S]EKA16937.1 hypothetical protein GMD2S_01185 [Streptococcus sp. GMD2S]